jgi:methionine-rich copper-binding protein CopC
LKPKALIVLAVIAWVIHPAMAHAFLERASPAAGEGVHLGPTKVELHFSEAIEPSFSEISVTGADGGDMSAGNVTVRGMEMDLPLKMLPPGRYRVTWHVVSADTHRTEGTYHFLILP